MKTLIFGAIVFISTFVGDVFPQSKSIVQDKNGGFGKANSFQKGDIPYSDSAHRMTALHFSNTGFLHLNSDSTLDWEAAGGVAINGAITGGGSHPGDILFVNGSGNLGVDDSFTWDFNNFILEAPNLAIGNGSVNINAVQYNFPVSQGSSNTFLKNDGSGNLSWATAGGGSSPITALTPVLGKASGTTDTTVIFRVPIPANTWADGQTIEVKELYTQAHNDPNDTSASPGTMATTYKIGDTVIANTPLSSLNASNCSFPDTCYDVSSLFVKRIGNNIWVLLGRNGTPAGATFPFPVFNSSVTTFGTNANPSFGNGDNQKPYGGIYRNIDFTKAQDITFTVNFQAAFPHNYIESKVATVWKY